MRASMGVARGARRSIRRCASGGARERGMDRECEHVYAARLRDGKDDDVDEEEEGDIARGARHRSNVECGGWHHGAVAL
jgi:hypothetical protein